MTLEQKLLITVSFSKLRADADDAAALFYERLFAQNPALRPMFRKSIRQQGRKFMQMLEAIVGCLEPLDPLVPMVWQMGKRHGGYGVQEAHYADVGAALLWTLEQRLGVDFAPTTCAAWSELYALIAVTMQKAASESIVLRDVSSS